MNELFYYILKYRNIAYSDKSTFNTNGGNITYAGNKYLAAIAGHYFEKFYRKIKVIPS